MTTGPTFIWDGTSFLGSENIRVAAAFDFFAALTGFFSSVWLRNLRFRCLFKSKIKKSTKNSYSVNFVAFKFFLSIGVDVEVDSGTCQGDKHDFQQNHN